MSPKKKSKKGLSRPSGRDADELRHLKIESGIIPNADGSAYIEMGGNKIVAAVYGPREMHPHRLAKPDMAVLRARYAMAPFSVDPRTSPAPSRRDKEISMVMGNALEPAVFLERYPRAVVDVYVEILQADGGTRCASVNAAAVALVDAGIPMRDLVASCAAGKWEGEIVLDLDDVEDKDGDADVPVAFMPKLDYVTLLQMDGILTTEETNECIELAIEGCKRVYEAQKQALKEKYGLSEEEDIEEEEEDE
ncbi:MAG: exosome complex exonuclease Rrp41 [Candidatus Bathyarchaeia archaeon]